jgi:dolichol-phosphate mannosyltransferase
MKQFNFAIVVPLANEAANFVNFTNALKRILDTLCCGVVYFVVDKVSLDNTFELCQHLSKKDLRFVAIYESENTNVVDAYLRGFKEAIENGHDYIIEMDAGLSHDPASIPEFLDALQSGFDCVFGSRFIKGGKVKNTGFRRILLSKAGTVLSNMLLGTKLHDMTSGYQGFKATVVSQILNYGLKSKAHFYQTELRYLLRKKNYVELPIQYCSTSPTVPLKAIKDAINTLMFYFKLRLFFNPAQIS